MRDVEDRAARAMRTRSCHRPLCLPRAQVYRRLCRGDGRGGCRRLHRRDRRELALHAAAHLRRAGIHGAAPGPRPQPAPTCPTARRRRSRPTARGSGDRHRNRRAVADRARGGRASRPARARGPPIPVAVSGRHVHLSAEAVEALFGKGYRLTEGKPLRQPGNWAAAERVTLEGPRRAGWRMSRSSAPCASARRSRCRAPTASRWGSTRRCATRARWTARRGCG
jgi:hypothetical protein